MSLKANYLCKSDLLVELHLLQAGLHVLLGVGQHDVAAVVVHGEVVDEEAGPDEVVEPLHDGAGQEQHEAPLLDEDHLPLDVQRLVDVLQVLQLQLARAAVAGAALGVPQLVDLVQGGELEHAVQARLNHLREGN